MLLSDLRTNRSALVENDLMLDALTFAPGGRYLATSRHGGALKLFHAATGERWRQLSDKHGGYALAFAADGRTLYSAGRDKVIRSWEIETSSLRREFTAHAAAIFALAVSPSGRQLASADETGVVLLHDLTQRPGGDKTQKTELLWSEMASADAARAERAAATLLARPGETLTWLDAQLLPSVPLDAESVTRLIADIDSPRFGVRRAACRRLEELGPRTVPALQRVLSTAPSLEVRRRVEQLLDQFAGGRLSPDELRQVRSVELLEHLGTSAARRLLNRLAAGASGTPQTEAATTTLARLARWQSH